jgi:hypothetical protein
MDEAKLLVVDWERNVGGIDRHPLCWIAICCREFHLACL